MNFGARTASVGQLYKLTIAFGLVGTAWMFAAGGTRPALAFFLGACTSLGNLWLYNRLARSLEPGVGSGKPWQASAFASRYLIFFAFGYVIVTALGVSPLPVVLGLFASTAAVLLASLLELLRSVLGPRRT